MTRYEKYKPSGIEWIGEIPEHWEALSLKHCVRTKITDGPHETPEFITEGVPFVSVEAIQNGTINFESVRGYISEEEDKRFTLKCKPQKDDIFIVKSGSTTGKIGYVHTSKNFNIWSPLALVRVKETYSSKYFYHFLQSDLFFTQVQLFWSFGTQPNIGMNVLENLKIVVPIAEEQTSIASYLDRKTAEIDQIIANKQKLIALYEEEKQAVINHAVTRGVNLNVRLKPSGVEWLGDIPEHWEVKKLKFVARVQTGRTPMIQGAKCDYFENGDINWFTAADFNEDGNLNNSNRKINIEALKNNEVEVFPENSIYLVSIGATLGKVGIAQGKGCANQQINIIMFDNHKVLPKYGYFIFKASKDTLINEADHTTLPILNQSKTKNLLLFIPLISEQQSIIDYVERESNRLDTIIEKCKKQIELLKEYRTTLISEVVTGKVKVSN